MKKPEKTEDEKEKQPEEEKEEYYDYLVDYYENPQLLDMTANEEDAT